MIRNIRRHGFTIIELLVSLTIALIIGTLVTTFINSQVRLTTHMNQSIASRTHMRDAIDILTADLRAASMATNGFPFASDTAIEFYSTIGASILCDVPANGQIVLPPDTLLSGNTLTSILITPDTQDIAIIYFDSSSLSPTRGWFRSRISNVATTNVATTCPPSSGFTSAADVTAGARALTLSLEAQPLLSIHKGAPVRLLRLGRYNIYRASDNAWYLGYRRCHPISKICDGVQPVSGPYTHDSKPPLSLKYYSASGQQLTPNGPISNIARLDIVIRSSPKRSIKIPGSTRTNDSTVAIITFRNRT